MKRFLSVLICGAMVVGLFTQKVCTAKVYATDPIEAKRERTWIKLTTKGEIPTNFWAREIPFETKPKPIHFIETGINLLHQKDLQSKLESQDQTLPGYKKAKAKVESLVQLMKKNGIDFENNRNTDPNFQVAAFNIHLSKQTGLYNWTVGENFLLIDPSQPTKYFYMANTGVELLDSDVQVLPSRVIRYFMTIYPQYAAGCAGAYSMVKVTDVDLDRKTILSNEFFGSFKDLRSNGTDTLVIGQEVSGEVYFFWAYEWDGMKWANRNRKYFDLYKDEPLRPIGYCAASGSDMLNELVKEIAEGVPLKYWKK